MESSKQEGILRQSSILKLPKQRQPLQSVLNGSSENSSVVKIKRRVSFAKNRRIREFSDEAEQDNVWDNTYEEHDFSNTKNSTTGNNYAMMISVPCNDKENFPIQLFLKSDKVIYREDPISVIKEDDLQYDLDDCDLINNAKSSKIDISKTVDEVPNITMYHNEGIDKIRYVLPNIALQNCHSDCSNESVLFPKTNLQNFTTNEVKHLPINLTQKNFNQNECTELNEIVSKLSTNESRKETTDEIGRKHISHNKNNFFHKKDCFNNIQIVFTETPEISTAAEINNQKLTNENFNNFIISNVESTLDISESCTCSYQNQSKSMNISNQNNESGMKLKELTELMPFYNNTEFSVIIPNNGIKYTENITNNFKSQPMETLTEESTRNTINHFDFAQNMKFSSALQEKTKIFNDEPMDLTEPLPQNLFLSINQTEKIILALKQKTSCENKSMEKTEALPIYKDALQSSNTCTNTVLREVIKQDNQSFDKKSVQITKAVSIDPTCQLNGYTPPKMLNENTNTLYNPLLHIRNNIYDDDINCPIALQIEKPLLEGTPNKTKIFFNKSMDITKIPSTSKKIRLVQGSVQNETKTFENKSMEITQAGSVYIDDLPPNNGDKNELLHYGTLVNNKSFMNKSIEMTETVPISRQAFQFKYHKAPSELLKKNTNIVSNTLMDIDSNVHVDDISNPISLCTVETLFGETSNATKNVLNKTIEVVQESVHNGTQIFKNKLMEKTHSVPIYIAHPQLTNVQTDEFLHEVTQEDTKIFANKSMEITESISINKQRSYFNYQTALTKELKTNHNIIKYVYADNLSYPTTSHLKGLAFDKCQNETNILQQSVQNRIKIFENKSIEKPLAISIYIDDLKSINVQTNEFLHEFREEDTEIFDNKSMDMTAVVCINRQIFQCNQCKTQTYKPDKSIKLICCPVLHIRNKVHDNDVSYIASHTNKPIFEEMDMGDDSPSYNKIQSFCESVQHKTKVFENKSMEITEAVPAHIDVKKSIKDRTDKLYKVAQEDTQIFVNKSMELTEAVSMNRELFGFKCDAKLLKVPEVNTKSLSSQIIDITKRVYSDNVNYPSTSYVEEIQSKTNIFLNNPMKMTGFFPYIYNQEESLKMLTESNFKLLENKAKEITKTIAGDCKMHKFNCNVIQKSPLIFNKDTDIFNNTSMELIKSIPMHKKMQPLTNQTKESIENKTKNFVNVSMEMTEPVYSYNNVSTSMSINAGKVWNKKTEEIMKNVGNESDICEVNNIDEYFNIGKNNLLLNDIQRTVDISNIPKEITESISFYNANYLPTTNRKKLMLMKYNQIQNKSIGTITDSIKDFHKLFDIKKEYLINKGIKVLEINPTANSINVKEDILKTVKLKNFMDNSDEMIGEETKHSFDKSIKVTDNIDSYRSNSSLNKKRIKVECKGDQALDNILSYSTGNTSFKPMKNYPWSNKNSKTYYSSLKNSRYFQHKYIKNKQHKLTANCHNTFMSYTEATSTSTYNIKDSKRLSLCNDSKALSDHVTNTTQLSINNSINSAKRKYEISDRFNSRDKIFRRLTSDELNTLCASINLPTEKYDSNKRITTENNYIQSCNDLNVLRDSLQKNILFEQESGDENYIKNNSEYSYNIMANIPYMDKVSINENKTLNIGINTKTVQSSERNAAVLYKNVNFFTHNKKLITNTSLDSQKNSLEMSNSSNIECNIVAKDYCEFKTKFTENLEDIQPPSFLCSKSIQEDSIDNTIIKTSLDSLAHSIQKQTTNNYPCIIEENIKSTFQQNIKQLRIQKLKELSNGNIKFGSRQTKQSINKILSFKNNNSEETKKSVICNEEEDEIGYSVTSFTSLIKNLQTYQKRNDCIWTVRTINLKFIAVEFISKTFTIIIRLKEMEKVCKKDIEKIEFISCILANSKNIFLKIVHKLLLLKLKPDEMLDKYKMFDDILPMLSNTSSEVISAMNFMFDIQRLSSTNVLNFNEKRISFMVSSKKANIILKICLKIKILNEIDPDDINVFCILGDIRKNGKNDVKQLIVNIKRDQKFLSRYITDIKEYITLMEESSYTNKS